VQKGKFAAFETGIGQMGDFLKAQRQAGQRLHMSFGV